MVISIPSVNPALTPCDLRAQTFTVNEELSADFHGHTQKNFEPKGHFGTFFEFFSRFRGEYGYQTVAFHRYLSVTP